MENEKGCSIKKILDLTMEIIYLLTGEDNKTARKLSAEELSIDNSPHGTSPSSEPPTYSQNSEVQQKQKILEVIKKMTELLTGEVPIRCQDVTVYLSMEEWEYLEGHKDLYKDVMMEDEPDGSRKMNPPQRCPHPRDSQDSTPEDHNYARNDQGEDLMDIKIEVKVEDEEETCSMGYQGTESREMMVSVKEEQSLHFMMEDEPDGSRKRNPPQRCPRPLEDLRIPRHDQVDESEGHKDLYKDITIEPPNERNPPQRCPRPRDFRDSTQEDLPIPNKDQVDQEELLDVKVEVKEEEEEKCEDHQQTIEEVVGIFTEESSLNINNSNKSSSSTSGNRNISGGHLILSPGFNDLTQYSPGLILFTPVIQQRPSNLLITTKPSIPTGSSSSLGNHTGQSLYLCSVCGKSFSDYRDLQRHQKNHKKERPYPCTECGKCFTEKRFLLRHQRSHTGERPFPCSECGKSFSLKENLLRHTRSHTGERPYSCSECGRGFSSKDNLVRHQRIHTGERPFSCLECGSSFTAKGDLRNHERTHTGERPYSCLVCGKSFILRSTLVRHQKTHLD